MTDAALLEQERWREIAQRIFDGDYASVDILAQEIAVVMRDQLAEIERLRADCELWKARAYAEGFVPVMERTSD